MIVNQSMIIIKQKCSCPPAPWGWVSWSRPHVAHLLLSQGALLPDQRDGHDHSGGDLHASYDLVDNGADDIDHADIVLTDGGGDVRRQHYLVNFDAGELER